MSCYFCDGSRIESIHDFPHHGFPNKTIGTLTLMRYYDGEPMVKVELDTDVTLDIRVDGSFRGCEDVSVTATGFIEGVNFCPFCGGKAEFTNGGYWGRELFKVKCSNKYKCVMLPETGAYFIKQQAAAAWNTRSDNA